MRGNQRDLHVIAEAQRAEVISFCMANRGDPLASERLVQREADLREELDVDVVTKLESTWVKNYTGSVNVLKADRRSRVKAFAAGSRRASRSNRNMRAKYE